MATQKKQSGSDASASESTALANRATSEVAAAAPAFMAGAKSGKENIERGDMIIPRVALMQSTHTEVEEGKAKQGDFFHTILEEVIGNGKDAPIDDLVIVHQSKRWNLWKPRHEGGGILARASDGHYWDKEFRGMSFEVAPSKDRPRHRVKWEISQSGEVGRDAGLGRWGTSDPDNPDSAPAATLSYVLVCVRLSQLEKGPFIILLQRTSEKVGKGLLSKISVDAAPMYGQVYQMGAKQQSSPSGDFWQYTFSKNGYVPDEQVFEKLRELNEQFDSLAFKYDERGGDEEGGTNGGGGDGGAGDGRY